MKRTLYTLAVFILGLTSAKATIVKSVSVQEMSRQADAIVHGIVTAQVMTWDESRRRIYTISTIEVIEDFKGALKKQTTVNVRQIGGTVDGLTQVVAGNAKLKEDEEVILFLERHPTKALFFIMGMAQGKYSVSRTTKPPSVTRNLDGITEVKPGQIPVLHHGAHTQKVTSTPPSLELFTALVRKALKPSETKKHLP
ncbi:MAG: hypothetical protein VX589_19945 [Myxococcota bacterium]|nr:hypothetical protein [Myxococcota bacterium]